jgi:hypothetical protein
MFPCFHYTSFDLGQIEDQSTFLIFLVYYKMNKMRVGVTLITSWLRGVVLRMKVVLEVSDHCFRDLRATAVVAIIQRTTILASAVEQTQWTVTGFHGRPTSRDLDGDSMNVSMASSRRKLTSHWTILHMSPYGTRKCILRGERGRERELTMITSCLCAPPGCC